MADEQGEGFQPQSNGEGMPTDDGYQEHAASLGEVAVGEEKSETPFADNSWSHDTRENVGLAEEEARAVKDVVVARRWWEQHEAKGYLAKPRRENILERYKDEADRLAEEAHTRYFAEQAILKSFESEDRNAVEVARRKMAGDMLALSHGGYVTNNEVLSFTSHSIDSPIYGNPSLSNAMFNDLYRRYYKDGYVQVWGFNRFQIPGGVSRRVTDQLRLDVYVANGCEPPEFTPEDFKRGKDFGEKVAVKRTPSSLPGIEAVEEIRSTDKKGAGNPDSAYGNTTIKLIPKAKEEALPDPETEAAQFIDF